MLIVNPNSGKNGMKLHLQDIIVLFHSHGWEVTVFPTLKAGDATDYARERYGDFDLVVCCGGDGTLNEVITGMMQQPLPLQLGYIPVGTANDLATTLHLKKTPVAAAADILAGHKFVHDIGCFNDRFFTYIAAFGTFSDISYSTSQTMKRSLGKMAYILQAVMKVGDIRARHVTVTIDGEVIDDDFVLGAVMNSTSFAGVFRLKEEEIKLDDGIFEVLLIKPPKNPIELTKIMDQLLHKTYDSNFVSLYHGREIKIHTEEETSWCLDGELGGSYQDVTIMPSERQMVFCAGK
ncbi:MAG: diacylglycerol kinase family lipid kinase [Oscillospiraceae bacterium]|nr:diacylglycerol kinase family lipid kinase [Oscillospiraceae bacterium]